MTRTLSLALIIFAVAFACRLFYVVHFQTYRNIEAAELERGAACLADEGFLGNIYSDHSGKSAHVSPLYPLLLSVVYYFFGSHTVAGRFVQELCSLAAASLGMALLPLVAKKSGMGVGTGAAAGLVMALLPVNIWTETSGSWEQPYAALLLLMLFLAFLALHENGWRSWGLVLTAGLLLGALALLSPSLLLAGGLLWAAEWWSQRGRRKQVVLSGLVMLLVFAAVLSPWVVRNYYALGGFVPFRSNVGLEFAVGNNSEANGKSFDTSWDDPNNAVAKMHPFANREEGAKLVEMGELAYMREKGETARGWIREHPGQFTLLTLKRFQLYWFPPVDMWAPNSSARLFKSLVFCALGAGCLGGLVLLFFSRHPHAWLWAAVLFGGSFTYMITHVDARYRYPLFGLSTLLTCYLVVQSVQFLGRLKGKPAAEKSGP